MTQECSALTVYTAQMDTRADKMQQSARNSAETTRVKTEEILSALNDSIEKVTASIKLQP